MIPQTLGDDSELTIAAKNGNETTFSLSGQKWNAGDKINYQIDIAGNPSDITNTVITNGFVGAFWEYDDTTERIIRMPNDGKWAVSVLCADNQWNTADIMLDTLPASYSRQQGVEISGDAVQMSNTKSILEGDGDIAFRVGLMEYTTLDSENSTPRFAILIVRHTDLTRNHLIYLRQGGIGYPVNGDAAFGVYNISWVPGMELDGVYYTMVNYPSRGGGYKAWSSTDVVYPPLSAKRKYSNGDELNSDYIENVCQDGYDLPSVQDFMDLLQITSGGYSTCCIGGLYADGYFDRGDIVVTTSSGGTTMTVGDDLERGYNGFLVYNNKSYASLFLPTAGCHPEALSTSLNIGTSAYYWSTDLDSLSTNITPYYLFSKQNNSISNLDISIGSDCPKSYALSLRPIYVGD